MLALENNGSCTNICPSGKNHLNTKGLNLPLQDFSLLVSLSINSNSHAMLNKKNVHLLFFLAVPCWALHHRSVHCGCNVRLLHTLARALDPYLCMGKEFLPELLSCKQCEWTMSVLISAPAVYWYYKSVCWDGDRTCNILIHRFLWMNDVAVWTEPGTATLFANCGSGCGENIPCPLLQRRIGGGQGICISNMLHPAMKSGDIVLCFPSCSKAAHWLVSFFVQSACWSKKYWLDSPIHTFNVDAGILPAELMYSYSDVPTIRIYWSALPALIERQKSDRVVVRKPISRSTSVQPLCSYMNQNWSLLNQLNLDPCMAGLQSCQWLQYKWSV